MEPPTGPSHGVPVEATHHLLDLLTDSTDRYHRYRPLIIQLKLSGPFSVLAIFTLFTIVFLKMLVVFSLPWQKTAKIGGFFQTIVLID